MCLTTTTLSPQPIRIISLTRISLVPALTLPRADDRPPAPRRIRQPTSSSPVSIASPPAPLSHTDGAATTRWICCDQPRARYVLPGLVASTTNTDELEATTYELHPRRSAATPIAVVVADGGHRSCNRQQPVLERGAFLVAWSRHATTDTFFLLERTKLFVSTRQRRRNFLLQPGDAETIFY